MIIQIILLTLLVIMGILFVLQKRRYEKEMQKSESLGEPDSLETEVLRLKKTLEDTKIIAQDATMIKSDFLTNIRHEIRTPMNAILAFSKMIEEESKEPVIRSHAYDIFKSGHYLLNLLNNIIEISEIDSGKFKINKSAVNVRVFIASIVEVHRYEIEKKGLLFSLEINENIPESIMIDVQRVKDILNNLLSNALKFTQKGEITLSVLLGAFDASRHEVEMSFIVKDTGLGILKINQEKIFQIFESKEINSKVQYQGTGLGLSINKKLAVLMNGSLDLESELNEGATFVLTLNNIEVVLVNNSSDINEEEINFNRIKPKSSIVIIDETQKTLDIVLDSFAKTQVKVLAYTSAKDAIPALQNTNVDLILIDIEILSMDDNAVGKVLKSVSSAPVISLVKDSLKDVTYHEDSVKPLQHLKKPLGKIDLFKIAMKLINSKEIQVNNTQIQEVKQERGLSFKSNIESSKNYFKSISLEMDKLLQEALATNDLSTISIFAQSIYELSLSHKVEGLREFSQELLSKIDAFDIQEIDRMLKEYDVKSKDFR